MKYLYWLAALILSVGRAGIWNFKFPSSDFMESDGSRGRAVFADADKYGQLITETVMSDTLLMKRLSDLFPYDQLYIKACLLDNELRVLVYKVIDVDKLSWFQQNFGVRQAFCYDFFWKQNGIFRLVQLEGDLGIDEDFTLITNRNSANINCFYDADKPLLYYSHVLEQSSELNTAQSWFY